MEDVLVGGGLFFYGTSLRRAKRIRVAGASEVSGSGGYEVWLRRLDGMSTAAYVSTEFVCAQRYGHDKLEGASDCHSVMLLRLPLTDHTGCVGPNVNLKRKRGLQQTAVYGNGWDIEGVWVPTFASPSGDPCEYYHFAAWK